MILLFKAISESKNKGLDIFHLIWYTRFVWWQKVLLEANMFKLYYDYISSVLATLVIIVTPIVAYLYVSSIKVDNYEEIQKLKENHKELKIKYLELAEQHRPYLILKEIQAARNISIDEEVLRDILAFHEDNPQYDLAFIFAIIEKESTFNPTVMSSKAIGLMQIHYVVWEKEFNIKSKYDLFKPRYNLELGFKILEYYKERYPDEDLLTILFYYNNGESGKYNNVYYGLQVVELQKAYKKIFNSVNRRIDGK